MPSIKSVSGLLVGAEKAVNDARMGVAVKLGQVVAVVSVAAAAITGCGDSKSDDAAKAGASQAGSAGSTSDAGSSAMGGSSAGASGGTNGGSAGKAGSGGGNSYTSPFPLGDTLTDGCIAYVYTACERSFTCASSAPGSSNCLRGTFDCPDHTGSEGSTRTPAVLKECAAAFDKLACEELDRGFQPSCVTPGTLPVGAKCVYPSQCSTLNCEYPPDGASTCGQCATEATDGEDCSSPTVDCKNGSTCGSDGKCSRYLTDTVKLNEPCTDARAICETDTFCSGGTCKQRPTVGGLCSGASLPCDSKSYCNGSQCMALPDAGAPCAVDPSFTTDGLCAASAECDWNPETMSGMCVKTPKAGDPCYHPDYEPGTLTCGNWNGLHCDESVSPAVCRAYNKLGDPCVADRDCDGSQAVCECADPATCQTRICRKVQFGGQPCTDPTTMCHPGFICEAGTCKARESQGNFATSCGQ